MTYLYIPLLQYSLVGLGCRLLPYSLYKNIHLPESKTTMYHCYLLT